MGGGGIEEVNQRSGRSGRGGFLQLDKKLFAFLVRVVTVRRGRLGNLLTLITRATGNFGETRGTLTSPRINQGRERKKKSKEILRESIS